MFPALLPWDLPENISNRTLCGVSQTEPARCEIMEPTGSMRANPVRPEAVHMKRILLLIFILLFLLLLFGAVETLAQEKSYILVGGNDLNSAVSNWWTS